MASPPALEILTASQDPIDDQVDIQQPPVDPPSHDDHLEISLHALVEVTTPTNHADQQFLQEDPSYNTH